MLAARALARHQIVRRQHVGIAVDSAWREMVRETPSRRQAQPVATTHLVEAELQHLRRIEPAVEIDRDIGHLRELSRAPIASRGPRRSRPAAGIPVATRPPSSVPASARRHVIAALAQSARGGSKPAGPAPTTSTRASLSRADEFRVPALAPFLAHGRGSACSGWATWSCRRRRRCCSRCIRGCRRCGLPRSSSAGTDRRSRPRRADEIENAALHLPHHQVGRGEAADADHRLGGQALDAAHEFFFRRLLGEARGAESLLQSESVTSQRSGVSAMRPMTSSTSAL